MIVTTAGAVTRAEIDAGRARVRGDARFHPVMNILVDHSDLDLASWNQLEITRMAASSSAASSEPNVGYVVIIAPTALAYGIARQWK